ncbi:MAG: RNA polymerase sigma-54 factor [Chlamydiia bacterium]|nr:RNA polymerase sigma-54 factor [Chlamydiia bacterium]
MKINQKIAVKLQNQMLQGFDFQMLQNIYALPGPLFSEYVEEYIRDHSALELMGQRESIDINYSLISKEETLYEHLAFQIETGFLLEEKEEALKIAASLDQNGFYEGEDSCVLQKIWYLDPVGVGTKSAKEAMIVQLKDQGNQGHLSFKILADGYKDFLKRDENALAKRFRVSIDDVKDAIQKIKLLNPFPGRGYDMVSSQYVVPEMKLEYKNKKWAFSFVKEFYPACRLIQKVRGKDKIEAKRFIYLLNQRKSRLEWIVSQIVKKQEAFLLGKGKLTPYLRETLLESLDISQSTLSRILSEKVIQTPMGNFPLGYFFTKKTMISSSYKEAKSILIDLIEQENKNKPYTDEELKEKLQDQGLMCSRRVIAKYRKALLIPGAYYRKRK